MEKPTKATGNGALSKTIKKYFIGKKGIIAAYLFGSHARQRAHPASDVDIAVLFSKNPDEFDSSLKISCDLMKALKVNRVDTVALNKASPVLKHQIYKYGKEIICNNQVAALRFKSRSFLEYIDFFEARKPSELAMQKRAGVYGRQRHGN